jgi:uncharacterized protein YndB with AHSA1/START domain
MENNGTISRKETGYKFRFERILNHPATDVFNALTNPEQLKLWFADTEIELHVKGKIHFTFPDKNKSEGFAVITRLEKNTLFEFNWEGDIATWELFEEGENKCRLLFTYSIMNEQWVSQAGAGWHIYLDQLETVLNGRTQPFAYTSIEPDNPLLIKYEQMKELASK